MSQAKYYEEFSLSAHRVLMQLAHGFQTQRARVEKLSQHFGIAVRYVYLPHHMFTEGLARGLHPLESRLPLA